MNLKTVEQIDILRNQMMEDTKDMTKEQMGELCLELKMRFLNIKNKSEFVDGLDDLFYKMAKGIYYERFIHKKQ